MLHMQDSLSFQEMVTSLLFLRGDGWPVSVAGGVLDASAPRYEGEDPVVIVDWTRSIEVCKKTAPNQVSYLVCICLTV